MRALVSLAAGVWRKIIILRELNFSRTTAIGLACRRMAQVGWKRLSREEL
jgi:hypothetical protein